MPIHSLNSLLKLFPYFFDKSETSNFYKSQKITNNVFKQIYNDLKEVYESFHLNKRLLVWKEQNKSYNYIMHFVSTFKLLKEVKIYCDDDIIYEAVYKLGEDESYSYLSKEIFHKYTSREVNVPIVEEDSDEIQYETKYEIEHEIYTKEHTKDENIIFFEHIHESVSENIIPLEKYEITVTTFDEYEFSKGFPENDVTKNNIYDHDISLDEIGAETNVPRKQYTTINESEYSYEEIIERYNTTDPPFNNQQTEDDYHYMKRLITYLIKYHTTSLPVLEIWKLYGVDATLTNRDKDIIRLFDETLHPPNPETGEFDWVPEPWEHKDFFVDEENIFGEYFFAHANTIQPVKKQGITFHLQFMNSLAEILTSELYTVDIFLNGDLLAEDVTLNQYPVPAELLNDDHDGNLFTFHGKKDGDVIKVINIIVKVRGCADADFYVNSDSTSEIEDGSYEHPFKTIEKAIENVNGIYNLIAVFGEVELKYIANIQETCYIIGCKNAKIINNIDSARFFNIAQEKTVTLQDITLQTPENTVILDNDIWRNNNILNLSETVVTPTVDYGVLISDLQSTTFMKNIRLEGNKIVYDEISKDELTKLSDTNNLVQDITLEGNALTYTEYTSISQGENLELPYIHLDDRLELVNAVEKLELQNNTLISTEYGDELAWEIKRHLI